MSQLSRWVSLPPSLVELRRTRSLNPSYGLFGVADNNGYGLKVFAFLRLAGVPFRHEKA
jgi:hypothetical protein